MDLGIMRGLARSVAAVTLALVLGITAMTPSVSAQSADAQIRIIHASPDAPAVDIWVNGEPAITDLAFGEATGLIPLPGGTYDVAVTPTGAGPESAVIEASLTLEAGAAYEVAAVGYVSQITAQVYPLDLSALESGSSRVRFVHASPDAPAVNINVNGTPTVLDLAFPNASDNLTVPAGTYDVDVAVAASGDVVLPVPGVALEAGLVYSVYAIGEAGAGTLTVLPLVANAATAAGGETGGMTHMPSTGIGSTATSSGIWSLLLAASAALLIGVGTMKVMAPARNR
jgi:hypothetical protein